MEKPSGDVTSKFSGGLMIGKKWFGKIGVTLFGREQWDGQKASDTWTDGGSIQKVLAEAQKALEDIVSENAVLAVSDFASTGIAALRAADGGEVILGVRIESGSAHQIIEVPLRELFLAALRDIRPGMGVDAEAQASFSALIGLGQQLAQLAAPPRPRPQIPDPNREALAQAPTIPRPRPGRPQAAHELMAAKTNVPRDQRMANVPPMPEWPGQ